MRILIRSTMTPTLEKLRAEKELYQKKGLRARRMDETRQAPD